MKIEQVKKEERKDINITLRTFPSYAKFMQENELSPTKIFNEAVKELMTQKK